MFLYYFSIIFLFFLSLFCLSLSHNTTGTTLPTTHQKPTTHTTTTTNKKRKKNHSRKKPLHPHPHLHPPYPLTTTKYSRERKKKKKTSTIAATTSKPTSRPITLSPLFLSQLKLLLSLKISL